MKANPKIKHTPFFFIILSFLIPYVLSQQQDSCSSPLPLPSPLPFNTTNLHCVQVWDSQNFVLRYVQAAPNVWNFLLSAPNPNAYIGMGFSPNGRMVGSRAIVGWVGSDGTSNMKKYFLGGQSTNLVRVEESPNQGLQIGNTSLVLQSNQIYMAFQLISSGNPSTRLIYAVGPPGRLPSNDNVLSEHRDYITTSLDYNTGQSGAQGSPQASLKKAHGLLTMVGWAILIPIGVMVARYMREWDPIWFYSHASIQSLGFILGLIGIISGLVLEDRLDANVTKHKSIGIGILVLGCLQVIAILIRPNKVSKVRKYWNWYHHGVGRVLIFLAVINVFYGIHLAKAGSSWNAGFAIALVVIFVVSVILELRMCLKK